MTAGLQPGVGAELRGATVVITGAGRSGQVGEVIATTFAQRGSRVVLVDRTQANVDARARDVRALGFEAWPFACDLTEPAQVESLAESVAASAPQGVKALVHLAGGYADIGPVAGVAPDTWHRMFAINLTTAYVTSRAFLPLVRQAAGSFVFFASAAALPGASVANSSAYAAAKGGVVTLMRAIAAEERSHGVRANALAPQAIRTEANRVSMGEDRTYVERETVAEWAWWLSSAASGPVSGQVIRLG